MMTDLERQQVLEVYAEADAAVAAAGPRCDASGRCCRFSEYGHTLFISHFEAEILLEKAPSYTAPASPDGCPFQIEGLCTARDSRPLGCRIYFCDPSYKTRMEEITEAGIAQLKSIADAYGSGWQYAPLHYFLNAAVRTAASPTDSMNPPGSRYALPIVGAEK
jgi:Fe-S-cluster containining protein